MIKHVVTRALIVCALSVAALLPAKAQNFWTTPGGAAAPGAVFMCLDANGNSVPASIGGACIVTGSAVLTSIATNNWPTPGGAQAQGLVLMCLNAQGQAVPATESGTCLPAPGGSGTVTSVSVVTANGVSGSVANPTTTPAITVTLGAITPTSVAIGAGSAITSSGAGGALGTGAFAAAAPCSAFGTTAGTCAQGGVITAGGPTGSATVSPIITYNAAGQLTTVSSATITPAVGSVTGLGTGVATLLGGNSSGTGGPAGTTSPTFVTPALGAATGTSVALGACTIGANSLCTAGAVLATGNLNTASNLISGNGVLQMGGGPTTILSRNGSTGEVQVITNVGSVSLAPASGSPITFGIATPAGAPTARTVQYESTSAGNNNGATATLIASLSAGSGTSGDWVVQTGVKSNSVGVQATATTALTIKGETQNVIINSVTDASSTATGSLQVTGGAVVLKRFWIPAISASSGLQTAVLCQSSGGEMIADSIACLASSARFKNIIGPFSNGAATKLAKLPIERWSYKSEGVFTQGNWTRERLGPIAEDVAAMDPRLAGYDADGNVRSYSTEQLLAFTIKSWQEDHSRLQQQQAEIDQLKERLH